MGDSVREGHLEACDLCWLPDSPPLPSLGPTKPRSSQVRGGDLRPGGNGIAVGSSRVSRSSGQAIDHFVEQVHDAAGLDDSELFQGYFGFRVRSLVTLGVWAPFAARLP